MPGGKKTTGKKAASAASKVLRDGRTSKTSKTAAGSALSQENPKRNRSPVNSYFKRPYWHSDRGAIFHLLCYINMIFLPNLRSYTPAPLLTV